MLRTGRRAVVGDFDSAGRPDLARLNNGRDGSTYGLSVLLNVEDGSFGPPTLFEVPSDPQGLAAWLEDLAGNRSPDSASTLVRVETPATQ